MKCDPFLSTLLLLSEILEHPEKGFYSCSALLGVGEGDRSRRGRGGRVDMFSYQTKDIKTQSNPHKEAN